MLNDCNFIGRLTRDPLLRRTSSGTAVTSFTLAVNRSYPTKDGEWLVDFLDFQAWRGMAEKICKYKKGDLLVVTGSLEIHPYIDKDNQKRNAAEVVVSKARKISSPQNSVSSATPSAPPSNNEEFREYTEEPGELPF